MLTNFVMFEIVNTWNLCKTEIVSFQTQIAWLWIFCHFTPDMLEWWNSTPLLLPPRPFPPSSKELLSAICIGVVRFYINSRMCWVCFAASFSPQCFPDIYPHSSVQTELEPWAWSLRKWLLPTSALMECTRLVGCLKTPERRSPKRPLLWALGGMCASSVVSDSLQP